MPRKQKFNTLLQSPNNYVHPSLASNTSRSTEPKENPSTVGTVNERIEYLRRMQSGEVTYGAPTESQDLDLSHSRHAPQHRRIPGPPPPRSWMTAVDGDLEPVEDTQRSPISRLEAFPGTPLPLPGSLKFQSLKAMAENFDWHVAHEGDYLSVVPLELRCQLLSFVACFGPPDGLSIAGLEACFPLSSGVELMPNSIPRLDLGRALGRGIPLKRLDKIWMIGSKQTDIRSVQQALPDSWDLEFEATNISAILPTPRFPCLTHLSLSNPILEISWGEFLRFSRHLGTLTHLSLAYWPRPQLQQAEPHIRMNTESSPGSRDFAEEAAFVLRILSRNTPSLEWISFEGCQSWFSALAPIELQKTANNMENTREPLANQLQPPNNAPPSIWAARRLPRGVRFDDFSPTGLVQSFVSGPEWTLSWRKVAYVNLSQGWVPSGLNRESLPTLIRARSQQSIALELDPMLMARRTMHGIPTEESYRVIAPTPEIESAMRRKAAMRKWYSNECEALKVAAMIRRRKTSERGQTHCFFDHGWGGQELRAAGYDDSIILDTGL